MDANIKAANQVKIATVIKNLEKRNMTGHYCETKEDAVQLIMEFLDKDALISWGGSTTLDELEIKGMLASEGYHIIDPFGPEASEGFKKSMELRRASMNSDMFLASANAITMDGEIVNIDATGNRVAAIVFGAKKVILVVGANKLAADEQDAIRRIKLQACPPNCIKLGRKSPCSQTGKCGDCLGKSNTICCHTVTTRFSMIDDRIHVILVNESLGY